MKVLHIFTEEPSAKNVFSALLKKILPDGVSYRIYSHQGKQDLEKALRTSLPSISKMPGAKILVTRDQDSDDCVLLKQRLDDIIRNNISCDYYIRIVCKELEAWFLGDLNAISNAYPRFIPVKYSSKSTFRDVDKISSPSKYLLKIVPELKKKSTLPKMIVSETIAPHLSIDKNRSKSFMNTLAAINKLVATQ
jgi:hypothetical protein